MATEKYSQYGPFCDPVLRCDSCQAIVKHSSMKKLGCCSKCGNKRFRNVILFNEEEKKQMEEWGFHDFVDEFGAVDE